MGNAKALPGAHLSAKITMEKKQAPKYGISNTRALLAFALCAVGVLLTISSFIGMGWDTAGCPAGSNCQKEGKAGWSESSISFGLAASQSTI